MPSRRCPPRRKRLVCLGGVALIALTLAVAGPVMAQAVSDPTPLQ